MGEAERKRQQRKLSVWPHSDDFWGAIDLHMPPPVAALSHDKLDGFSVERLMIFLTALDQDVEIVITKKPRSRAAGRISVVAG